MIKNPTAFAAGQLSQKLFEGYFSHLAALTIASDKRAFNLMPPKLPNELVPSGNVSKKDGTLHTFHFPYFLEKVSTDKLISDTLKQIWLSGSIIILSDVLTKNNYFDRAPELELLRHLRNGIAHGNTFKIDEPYKLVKYPAHNKDAWCKGNIIFEITPNLHSTPVLFDFMDAGDILDLFQSISIYLIRMGNGDPLRP